ncbi:MAG: HAMP domain-containing histidine kinase [Oscillospiraceae bacterium]|nr:HAMP domain-containing histidine kinase [Oscillospiraceae bacterium]
MKELVKKLYAKTVFPVMLCNGVHKIIWHNIAATKILAGFDDSVVLSEILPDVELVGVNNELNVSGKALRFVALSYDTLTAADFTKFDDDLIAVTFHGAEDFDSGNNERVISIFPYHFRARLDTIFNNVYSVVNGLERHGMYKEMEEMKKIKNAGYSILRSVVNLTEYRRLASGLNNLNKKIVEIPYFLSSLLDDVRRKLSVSGMPRIKVELPDQSLFCEFDCGKFEIALLNIIHNAVLFTSPGNEISIEGTVSKDYFNLSFSDKGVGIEKKRLGKVFDLYYSYNPNDEAPAGLGIGLPLTKKIVEMHGGVCMIKSNANDGTTFVMRLPLAKEVTSTSLHSNTEPYHMGNFSSLSMHLSDLL